ncbi:glycoside hydrolase family 130 protein [Ruminiclostridium cellulolyticum]|uniref:Glycosidase PH1107-related n=1 Tax=Ruminiclostridium cellulolyticum (strain ATCC 35319 / DSM 5812 / JCM 6584 / H10) TaxID=394503 RepID=B8I8W3_RUMCH|nr:glycoside hydrolase family 130 protein [Ruminiclostridium cellulolyticum]ACL77295.1 glycosidase PH1107-related [Ruminiclostridium cellulolyticum H10]
MSINGKSLKNIPWQDKPLGCNSVIWRHKGNPIIVWNPTPKTARIYNSSVVPWNSGFAGIFRADHKDGKAQIHVGFSSDGVNWNIEDEPIVWHDEDGNLYQPNYSYDPRIVELEGIYYIVWCTDFGGASLGLGVTKNFKQFTRLENPFIPFNRNGVLFPRKVNGKYLLLSRPSDTGHTPFGDIFISESPDLVHWGRHRRVMQKGGSGWWQSVKIGAGAVPIETTEGWLLFYHGVSGTCNGFVYSFGAAILDIEIPSKVLYRTRDYLLTPEMSYETSGFVPNVVFPCAALHDSETGRIAIYYGAADTYSALAYAKEDELINFIKSNSELLPGDAEEYR